MESTIFSVRMEKIPFTIMSSKSKASAEDFTKAKENFYAIRNDYKKKGGKELTLDEINKVICR